MKIVFFLLSFVIPTLLLSQDTSLETARRHYDNQQYESAILTLEKLIKTPAATGEAYEVMVRCYADRGWASKMNGQNGSADLDKALAYGKEAVKKFSRSAAAYKGLGYSHHYNQQYSEAKVAYEAALKLDDKDATTYFLLWTVTTERTEDKVNSPLIKKALELKPDMADAWQRLGDFYKELKQNEKAIEHYERAAALRQNYILLFSLGQLYGQQGDLEKAESNYRASIALQKDFAFAYYGLATVYLAKEDIEAAVKELNTAIELNPGVYEYYQSLLTYYPDLAKHQVKKPRDKAIEKSQLVQTGIPEHYMEAIELAQKKDYAAAINLFNVAIKKEEGKTNPNTGYLVSMYNWQLHCFFQLGRYSDAINMAQQSIPFTNKYGLRQDVASILATMAAIYSEWGDYKNAVLYTEESIKVLKELNLLQNQGLAYGNLCEIYRSSEKFDKSVDAGRKAIEFHRELKDTVMEAQNYNSLSRTMMKKGNLPEAEKMVNTGFQLLKIQRDAAMIAELELTQAEIFNAQGKFKEALTFFDSGNKYFSGHTNRWHPSYRRILKAKALIHANSGNVKIAQAAFIELFDLIDIHIRDYFTEQSDEGKTRFFRTLKADYEMYNNFALRYYKTNPELLELMFNNQLRIKALLLNTNQKIRHQILNGKDETLKQVFIYWQEKRNELAKIYFSPGEVDMEKVKALGDTINSAETYLSRSSAEFKTNAKRSKSADWQEIAGSLKKDQAVVEIIRFREFNFRLDNSFGEQVRYGALILSGNTKSFQFVTMENGKELETKYYNYYIYTMQGRGEDTRSYTNFFSPIADKLNNIKTVFVSPDGIFYKINFNTLVDSRDGKFLVEKFDIRLLTNSRELTENNSEFTKDKVAVLVGFPNYATEPTSLMAGIDTPPENESVRSANLTAGIRGLFKNVAELPGTLDEVKSIETTLASEGWHVTKFLQNDAREENLKKLVNPRILHIATHGYFEQTDTIYNPLLASGLLLAGASSEAEKKPGDVEDGILTAYEAMNLNLDETQLVVLSACETGKGIIQNGEGVYGLQSAFKVAGSKNIIMSLWKVDDGATQKLMSFFYKNYGQAGDLHTAFKEAQLLLKKEYSHPFYWGAFVLIGQ